MASAKSKHEDVNSTEARTNTSRNRPAPAPKRRKRAARKTGRRRALNDVKRAEICTLLTAGASLRKAAQFVDCDPQSIRREAQRNSTFRNQLLKAKSGAKVEPLITLRTAAQHDWRAAVSWMKCADPERYARADANSITKREANVFVDALVESIEEAVSDPDEREILFERLVTVMPPAMRRRWELEVRDRAMTQLSEDIEERQSEKERQESDEQWERAVRRRKLFEQLSDYLTPKLYKALEENKDLLDPAEFFARTGGWRTNTDPNKDGRNLPPHLRFKPCTIGAERYGPELYHDDWKSVRERKQTNQSAQADPTAGDSPEVSPGAPPSALSGDESSPTGSISPH